MGPGAGSGTAAGSFSAVAAGPGRLDRVLADACPGLSRTRIQVLVREGAASVDASPERDPGRRLVGGEALVLEVPAPVAAEPAPEAIPLVVPYEDARLIVVDKPAGLVVHPAPGHPSGTLVNALLGRPGLGLSGVGGVLRPGIVHRLDKDTSGLLVVAKDDEAHRALAAQFADHGREGPLERAYAAFAWGVPLRERGTVEAPLERDPRVRERMAVARDGRGRHALTRYAVEEVFRDARGLPVASRLTCELETGRTHQIRVHLAHLGHPILADPLYGRGQATKASRLAPEAAATLASLGPRQALHAGLLAFAHPGTGEVVRLVSPLPPDLAALAAALRG